MRAPESLSTSRLLLRRPTMADIEAVFRYARDPDVTRWVGFSRHLAPADAEAFVSWSDHVWSTSPAGPYLIVARDSDQVLGSTGLDIETPWRAATGYVLARAAWGRGYATEAVAAMTAVSDALELRRLYAVCHREHRASARVLAKSGFVLEGVLRRYFVFPNLGEAGPSDVECWARVR